MNSQVAAPAVEPLKIGELELSLGQTGNYYQLLDVLKTGKDANKGVATLAASHLAAPIPSDADNKTRIDSLVGGLRAALPDVAILDMVIERKKNGEPVPALLATAARAIDKNAVATVSKDRKTYLKRAGRAIVNEMLDQGFVVTTLPSANKDKRGNETIKVTLGRKGAPSHEEAVKAAQVLTIEELQAELAKKIAKQKEKDSTTEIVAVQSN